MSCSLVMVAVALLPSAPPAWRAVVPGAEYAAIAWDEKPSEGDGILHVVRVDPTRAEVVTLCASARDGKLHTAAEWSARAELAVVINAGMFEPDYSTHVGHLRVGEHVNAAKWVKKYFSLLALGPERPGLPRAVIVDLDETPAFRAEGYRVVNQNLRLIKAPGENRWPEQNKRWSEAAVAIDGAGRLLFLFSRTAYSMHDFNARLLRTSLGVRQAFHVEGGPEASLSIHGGGVDLDLAGSFETGFNEDDANAVQWELPNVLAVKRPAAD